MHFRLRSLLVLAIAGTASLPFAVSQNPAQSNPPDAPQAPAAPGSGPVTVGPASAPTPFPPIDPANFTAKVPTRETVEAFLHAYWGYDNSRTWQVAAILPTQAAGVSRVIVLVKGNTPPPQGGAKDQTAQLSFFTLPDQKYLVADQLTLLPFGEKPFAEARDILKAGANGPSEGGASKDLEIVEFSDFQCPHCKDAQPIIAKLVADYPTVHVVYQDFPLTQVHSEALKSSTHGYCVAKSGGNEAFFKFADAVFSNQAGLTPEASDATLKDAETKAGQDPAKISACAATPAAKEAIDASRALGEKVGVNSTPTIYINGRGLPVAGIPYETLQKIIEFQAQLDGVALTPAAKKPAPSLR